MFSALNITRLVVARRKKRQAYATRKVENYMEEFVRKPDGKRYLNEQIEDNIKVDLKEREWKDGLDLCGSGYGKNVGLVIMVP